MKTPFVSAAHHVIVPLQNGFMRYVEQKRFWSNEIQAYVQPSVYVETIDYSDVCDACLEDLPESKYLLHC